MNDGMPNFWWCSTHHLYRGGTERPCADAVKLGDVEAAMQRLADLTRAAGKTRTAPWIEVCAAEPDPSKWPPAPAYKGAVLHIEDEAKTPQDLASMPDEWLTRLTGLVVEETARRGLPDSETERAGCCTACNGTGDAGGYPCEDCYATSHSHADDVNCDGRARAEREANRDG